MMRETTKRHDAPRRIRKVFGAAALLALACAGAWQGVASAQAGPPRCAYWQGPVYSGGRWVCMDKQSPSPTTQRTSCPMGTTAVRSGGTIYCQRLGGR